MDSVFASGLVKYFELLAGIVGIYCYHKSKNRVWIIFALYLIALFGMEYTGYWFGKNEMYKQNTHLYKYIVIPSLFTIYHCLFYNLIPKHKIKITISWLLFIVFAVLENLVLSKEHYFSISMSVAYGCLVVSIWSILYLLNLVKTDDVLHFKSNMGFWVCTGLLIFYVGSFVKLTFFNSLGLNKGSFLYDVLTWAFIILNYIMYTFFTIGFICSKPK